MVKLKIGIIGFGNWGRKIYKTLKKVPECEIVAVCDKRKINLNEKIIFTDNYKDLMKMNLDGVIIATPNESHYSIAFDFLITSHNLFVEKPLATSFEESMLLINLAEKRNLNVFTGHILLYHPLINEMRKFLMNKRNIELRIKRTNNFLFLNKNPKEFIYDLFPHDVAILLYLFNKDLKIKKVEIDKHLVKGNFLIGDEIKASGIWGEDKEKGRTIVVFLKNQKIIFDGLLSTLKLQEDCKKAIIKNIDFRLPLYWELKYFINSLKNKKIKEKIPSLKIMAIVDKIEKLI